MVGLYKKHGRLSTDGTRWNEHLIAMFRLFCCSPTTKKSTQKKLAHCHQPSGAFFSHSLMSRAYARGKISRVDRMGNWGETRSQFSLGVLRREDQQVVVYEVG